MIDLVISIINYKTPQVTAKCIRSILEKKWKLSFEIWLVDNASGDHSVEYLRKNFIDLKIIESEKNLGFAGGHNLILKKAKARYFLILNSDVELLDGALDNLVELMDRRNYGIAGCMLLNTDKSFQPNGGDLPSLPSIFVWLAGLDDFLPILKKKLPSLHRNFLSYYKKGEVGWVGGTAMIIRSKIFKKIGYLDDHIFMYAEDIEFCMRANTFGFKVGWTDDVRMIHSGGASLDDVHFRQWLGEFKGLIYIYEKHFGFISAFFLKILIYVFTSVRVLAFALAGKLEASKTYAKVIASI